MSGASLNDTVNRCGASGFRATLLGAAAVFCSVLATVSSDRAMAADWPLRGTVDPGYARWDGWQFGVLAGYGNMNVDFGAPARWWPLFCAIRRWKQRVLPRPGRPCRKNPRMARCSVHFLLTIGNGASSSSAPISHTSIHPFCNRLRAIHCDAPSTRRTI